MGEIIEAVVFAAIVLTVLWWPLGALALAVMKPERLTFREVCIIYGPIMVPAKALAAVARWLICFRARADCKHNITCKKCHPSPVPAASIVRDGLAYTARPARETVRQELVCRAPLGSACDRCGKPVAAGSGEQQIRLCTNCAFKGSFGPRKFA